jgi:hypothetical protein
MIEPHEEIMILYQIPWPYLSPNPFEIGIKYSFSTKDATILQSERKQIPSFIWNKQIDLKTEMKREIVIDNNNNHNNNKTETVSNEREKHIPVPLTEVQSPLERINIKTPHRFYFES